MQRCDAAFALVNRTYLAKVARFLNWLMEDMRQEFRLVCWEAWSGQSAFDPSKGDITSYFIGRIRTLLYKRDGYHDFSHDKFWNTEGETDNQTRDHHNNAVPSVLDTLMDRENAQDNEAEERNWRALCSFMEASAKKKGRHDPVSRLWEQGLSQTQIARISGYSQAHISRILKKQASASCLACS
ncbi:MAG: hypothetical protein LBU72_01995 [Burkholderiaceae bacterium]|jgi:hypothetical protein|nr:hypothetical protein [Burkholderiaceae bacterium]